MQLILAIDADQRQVGQLASLVRERINAELIQADSAGEALQALGERVPDLIMTSRLLSPFDEGVLAEYLREIGPAAAHVQTLHIPVFGVAKAADERSLFSFGRKRKTAPTIEGCDPNLFAEEIALYLARAAEERQNIEATEPGAYSHAPIEEPDDTPITYVAAYESDDYVAQPASDDSSNFAWQPEETPVYETPVTPPAVDSHLDLEPTAASIPEEAIEDERDEPFTYRVEEIALGEPETPAEVRLKPDTTSYAPEPVSEPQHAVAHVEEEHADEPREEAMAYSVPAPVWRRSETFSPQPTVLLEPETTSCAPEAEKQLDEHIDLDPPVEQHEAIADTTPQVEDEPRDAAPVQTIEPIAEPPDTVAYSEPASAVETSPGVEAVATMEPAVVEAIEPPAAPQATEPEAIAENHAIESVEAPKATSAPRGRQRRSPSFESALALIRKAWKKSDGPAPQEPSTPTTPAQNDEPALSAGPTSVVPATPTVPAADPVPMAAPVASAPVAAETTRRRAPGDPMEVDLTCDIDALEDPALMDAQLTVDETPAPDDDVYELSASPVLHDLDADIAAAAPPRAVPQSLPETDSAPAAKAETQKKAAGKKGAPDQRRKHADKRKAPPQDAKRNNNRPAQDEWGLFDPNRCGFAAVVEKLNEVTEEDPKAAQTSVRVISYK